MGATLANSGIWYLDKINKKWIQPWASGANYQFFFENKVGDVFLGSSAATYVMGLRNDNKAAFFPFGFVNYANVRYYFEDPDTDILFASGSAANFGIWKYNYTTRAFAQILTTGTNYDTFFKHKKTGKYFVSGQAANSGILEYNPAGNNFVSKYSLGNNWRFFERSNGELYAWSTVSADQSILKYNETTGNWDLFFTVGVNFTVASFYEDKSGEFFLNTGKLWLLDAGTFVDVYATTTAGTMVWNSWAEDNSGGLFVGGAGTGTASVGILKFNRTTRVFDLNYATNGGWRVFATKAGQIFAFSIVVSGFIRLYNPSTNVFDQVSTQSNMVYNLFTEDSKGRVWIAAGTSGGSGNPRRNIKIQSSSIGNK